jgi:hypothetical protein
MEIRESIAIKITSNDNRAIMEYSSKSIHFKITTIVIKITAI